MNVRLLIAVTLTVFSSPLATAETVTFEGLLPGADMFYNGDSGGGSNSDGWSAGGVFFNNTFTDAGSFTFWSGWSYSNTTDTITPGFGNQYSSAPGGGSNGVGGVIGGETYAVAFGDGAYFNLPAGVMIQSADLTNTTYAQLSMLSGDAFAKQFGGPTGDDPDFFRVTLEGFDGLDMSGASTGLLTVDLADYTFADNSQDFVIGEWVPTDLTALGNARSVALSFASSDVDPVFGIRTPTYVALDNLTFATAVPEPGSFLLLSATGAVLALRWRRMRKQRLVSPSS